MTVIIGFLSLIAFIGLIVGLIKPNLVLRWVKSPTRLKVFGYWIGFSLILGVLGVLTTDEAEVAQSDIETAERYISENKLELAESRLSSFNLESELYPQAQILLERIDSLRTDNKEKSRIAKIAKDKEDAILNKDKIIESLKKEIKSIDEGIDFKEYRGTVTSLQIELALFSVWAKKINEGLENEDPEAVKLANRLKSRVSKIQVSEFPKMRKEYTKLLAKQMWENDIEVTALGSSQSTINFTGGIFAANKNKKDFQGQLGDALRMYRFKQSRYRWYDGQDEYTYYSMKPKKDSEVFEIK